VQETGMVTAIIDGQQTDGARRKVVELMKSL